MKRAPDGNALCKHGAPHPKLCHVALERTLCSRVIQGYVEAHRAYLYRILLDILQLFVHVGAQEILLRSVGLLTLLDGIETRLYLLRKSRHLVDTDAAGVVDTIEHCTVAGRLECLGRTGGTPRTVGDGSVDVD